MSLIKSDQFFFGQFTVLACLAFLKVSNNFVASQDSITFTLALRTLIGATKNTPQVVFARFLAINLAVFVLISRSDQCRCTLLGNFVGPILVRLFGTLQSVT